jgi:hypothetical protein
LPQNVPAKAGINTKAQKRKETNPTSNGRGFLHPANTSAFSLNIPAQRAIIVFLLVLQDKEKQEVKEGSYETLVINQQARPTSHTFPQQQPQRVQRIQPAGPVS